MIPPTWIHVHLLVAMAAGQILTQVPDNRIDADVSVQFKNEASQLVDWSREFLSLLKVDLPVGQSWHKELEPIVNFVKSHKEDALFLPWLKFLSVVVVKSGSGGHEIESGSKTSLNLLLSVIQQLSDNHLIDAATNFLSQPVNPVILVNETCGLEIFTGGSRNFPGHEMSMDRFLKQLYNVKRRHFKTTTTTTTAPTVVPLLVHQDVQGGGVGISPSRMAPNNSHVSPPNMEALRLLLVDLFKQVVQSGGFTAPHILRTKSPNFGNDSGHTTQYSTSLTTLGYPIKGPEINSSDLQVGYPLKGLEMNSSDLQVTRIPETPSSRENNTTPIPILVNLSSTSMNPILTKENSSKIALVPATIKSIVSLPPSDSSLKFLDLSLLNVSSKGLSFVVPPKVSSNLEGNSSIVNKMSSFTTPLLLDSTTPSSGVISTEKTSETITALASTTTTTATTSLVTTTTTAALTTLSLEERVAALFPRKPATKFLNTGGNQTSTKFSPKIKFSAKKKTTTPKTTTTTTPYQKYPTSIVTESTTMMSSSVVNIWTHSDIEECKSGRNCVFSGELVVSGFFTFLQKDFYDIAPQLSSSIVSGLQQILADSHFGSSRDKVTITGSDPIKFDSALIKFNIKIVEPAMPISAKTLIELINNADESYFSPYTIDRTLTHLELSNPEASSSGYQRPARLATRQQVNQTLSPFAIAFIIALVVIVLPVVLWILHSFARHIRAKKILLRVKTEKPHVYVEMQTANHNRVTNNLYSAVIKKPSKTRVSMFDVEREKEKYLLELKRSKERTLARTNDSSADRPLPPVPRLRSADSSPGSPMMNSSFQHSRKTTHRYLSGRFGFKKDEHLDQLLNDSANGGIVRESLRRSSFKRLSQITQSLRIRKQRIRMRQNKNRPSLSGLFNAAFVSDDLSIVAEQRQEPDMTRFRPELSTDAIEVLEEEEENIYSLDTSHHDYETIGFLRNKNVVESDAKTTPSVTQVEVHREAEDSDVLDEHIYGTI